MKRKIMALVVVAMLSVAALVGCSSEPSVETSDLVGTWKPVSVTFAGGTSVESDVIDEYGYGFTFSEDGSATVSTSDITYDTTYEISGNHIVFGNSALSAIKLDYEDGTLNMSESVLDIGMDFERIDDSAA